MSRVLLVRHAVFDGVGQLLAGRSAAVHLSEDGRAQAQRLAAALAAEPLAAVYTSPQPRAVETAHAIAHLHDLEPIVCAAFDEVEFGEWTGRSIASLDGDPTWTAFNTARTLTRIPGGELMLEVQARAAAGLIEVQRKHHGATITVVTHADVIRCVLAHALGMPIDAMLRLGVEPASVSALALDGGNPHVQYINRTQD